jgi:hypothetical protein
MSNACTMSALHFVEALSEVVLLKPLSGVVFVETAGNPSLHPHLAC